MTSDERKAESNGIWLCCNCADLIDKDVPRFPTELLCKWKADAEARARRQLESRDNDRLVAAAVLIQGPNAINISGPNAVYLGPNAIKIVGPVITKQE